MCSPTPEQEPQAQRLFFALWPSDALRRQLQRNCKSLLRHTGGRPVPAENLHITLAYLGSTSPRQRACVEAMADAIHCPRFSMWLTESGHWSRPRVLWIAPAEMPDPLVRLAAQLHDGAGKCGLRLDSRPYCAHVTLKRKLANIPRNLKFQPVRWDADRFVLVHSISQPAGVRYEVIAEWALGAG